MTVININDNSAKLNTLRENALSYGCEAIACADMSEYTSFKTGGKAELLITPKSLESLKKVLSDISIFSLPLTVIGNGSNILVGDSGINGVVLRLADGIMDLKLVSEDAVFCGSGVKLITLCKFALENSLSGLEFAYGIPGSAGGAAFMNAGAYGGEMKDVITRVYFVDKNGTDGSFGKSELNYGYRSSAFVDSDLIITGMDIKLAKSNKELIQSKMDELLNKRKSKQPLEYPSAGSTFKRPEGHFAGQLIEECGLKGKQIGGAAVSEKHAGFVINKGGATSSDILALIDAIADTVKEKTGVTLEPEVRILR